MHFPYFSGCAEVFLPNMRASLTRRLWPVNSRSRPWCTMRSMIAAASLSAAFVEPLLRIPCTQRRSVERGMPYSALICDDGLPFPLRLHDLPLELLLVMTGTIRIGHDDQLLRCHVPHEPVQYIVANPVVAHMEDIHTLTRPTFY